MTLAFVVVASLAAFGQDKKVDEVVGKWKDFFNQQDYMGAYNLYSPTYRQRVPPETLKEHMHVAFGMMGKVKTVKFISFKDHVYRYVFRAKANQIEADITLVVDKNDQFNYFAIDKIGGHGDPPPMAKGAQHR